VENKVKRAKRQFSLEFKKEAIELAKKVGNTKAAKELGLSESLIRSWKSVFTPSTTTTETKTYSDLEKENKRLNKELYYLKEINKVLKKSTAIFSVDQLGDLK
jgi:transposase